MDFGKHLEYFFEMLVISNRQYFVKNINLSPQNSILDLIPIFRGTHKHKLKTRSAVKAARVYLFDKSVQQHDEENHQ